MNWKDEAAWKESVRKKREERKAKEEARLAGIRGLTGHSIIKVIEEDYEFTLIFDNGFHVTAEEGQFGEGAE